MNARHTLAAGIAIAWAAVFCAGAAAAADRSPVVVELFTSQGCNSCPPADAYLGELAAREDVLALSIHVDYWDYLGWRDTFATPEGTQRQRDYDRWLGKGYVYTPQMVVGGQRDAVGSHRQDVERQIDWVAARMADDVTVTAKLEADDRFVARIEGKPHQAEATVWLVRFDRSHEVDVRRGENAGKKLIYHNVVRDLTAVGKWHGGTAELPLASSGVLRMGGRDACAILVQDDHTGAILGAAQIDLGGDG